MKRDAKSQVSLRYLSFLTQTYVMFLVFAEVFHLHFLRFWDHDQDVGKLLLCVTFLLLGSITEVYGYQQARRALWCGFLFNLLLMLYVQLVIHLPSPLYATHNPLLNALLAFNTSPLFAFITTGASFITIYLIAQLKIKYTKFFVGYRLFFAAWIGVSIQTMIFNAIFAPRIGSASYFAMTFTLLLFLPLFTGISQKLKRIEHLDIFDTRTRFNPFCWRVAYTTQDNPFETFDTPSRTR